MTQNGFKKILVPLDGSKNSLKGLDLAIYLARQNHATITGLYVIPFYFLTTGLQVFGPYKKQAMEQAKKFMYEAKVICARHGIVCRSQILRGDVIGSDIVNFAHSKKFDLIVISSRGFGPVKEFLIGSVSYYVLHKSKIPVLIVK